MYPGKPGRMWGDDFHSLSSSEVGRQLTVTQQCLQQERSEYTHRQYCCAVPNGYLWIPPFAIAQSRLIGSGDGRKSGFPSPDDAEEGELNMKPTQEALQVK